MFLWTKSISTADNVTGPDGAVAKWSAKGTGRYVLGSYLGTDSNSECVLKAQMGRCKATTPSSLSLTSNRVTTNY